jgi:hypothetical protein
MYLPRPLPQLELDASPIVNASDVFSQGGLAYGGTCTDPTGAPGNQSVDPVFVRTALCPAASGIC